MAKLKVTRVVPTVAADTLKAAQDVKANLEKKYGKGTLVRLGERVGIKHPCIPTGLYPLDHYVIEAGGFPRGRVVEVYGPESSGKTTITLQIIAQAQKLGGLCAFVDAEHALDPSWADKLGVDVENLEVSQPDDGEQALDIAEELVRSGAFAVVVIDSVAALVPRAELSGEMGDSNVGLQARMMSQALRKLTGAVAKTGTCLIFINQLREKIGVMFGSPETTTGGRALKFFASLRLDVRRIGQVKVGETVVGNRTKFKAAKNKVGPPFRECEVDLLYGSGFDTVGSVVDCAVGAGVIHQSGAWFDYQGERLGQGKANVVLTLKANEELFKAIYAALLVADAEEITP